MFYLILDVSLKMYNIINLHNDDCSISFHVIFNV